ncbi:MAG: RnfABCDGE type electron transport complex subunit D [Acidimicrobiia bacterium]|nr:RnfABCDGE type electron transport complex subunit D [Acidimicrobiia bacterium]
MSLAERRMTLEAYLLAFLGALIAIGVHAHGVGGVLPQTLIAASIACALDVALRAAFTGVRTFPTSALVSGLIVALVLPEGRPWYVPMAAAAIAIGSKHLVRWGGSNVFNPAAAGVAVSVFLFPGPLQYGHASYLEPGPRIYYARGYLGMDGWSFLVDGGHGWTGSTSAMAVMLLGAVLVYRLRRVELVTGYLASYVALIAAWALLSGDDLVARLVLEVFATGVPFFAFIMLTDPATSPSTVRARIVYGGFAALLSFLFRLVVGPVLFLLVALLTANLVLTVQRQRARPASSTEAVRSRLLRARDVEQARGVEGGG